MSRPKESRDKNKRKSPKRAIWSVLFCKVCDKHFEVTPVEITKKYCSRKCMNSCKEYRDKLKNIDRSYMKTEAYRNATVDPNLPIYHRYQLEVQRLSEETYQKYKDEINPKNYIRTLCGIEGGYQLDHIKSIKQCFNKGLSPKIVAKKNNLQML